MTTTTLSSDALSGHTKEPGAHEPAVKEAPASPMAANDFTIKAFGAEPTGEGQTSDISCTLQRKESLPKASPSPSPRGELTAEKSAGKVASLPAHQRLYERGLAQRQKREAAAAEQAAELTFKPEISPRSRHMSSSGRLSMNGKPAPVYERLSSVGTDAQKRLEKLRQQRLEAERQACTFKPQVNKYSEKLLAQRTSNYGGNAQARQQAYLKKMHQTFGGALRTSGYGGQGVNHPGSASIGGSLRSRQVAQRKSLVGCDATPAMLAAAAAANQELPEKLKRELQAAYGIKPREESPLEEVERWYKAGLQEQEEIERAAEAAQLAAWAACLKEVEDWWRQDCDEGLVITAAADIHNIEADAGQISELSPMIEEEPDHAGAEITDDQSEVAAAAAAAAVISLEVAEQEVKLDEVKQLLEVKEAELLYEITQLDEALQEVKTVPPQIEAEQTAAAAAAEEEEVIEEKAAATAAAVEPAAAECDSQKVDEVVTDVAGEGVVIEPEVTTEEVAVKLKVGKKAAIKLHSASINAAIRLHGSKAKAAMKLHSAKIMKALKKGSSGSSTKVKHHAAAMAAAIQKNGAKMADVMTHHSARIAALTKDAAAAAAIKQHAAAFAAKMQQLGVSMSAAAQQYSASTAAEAKQKSAAVAAAIKTAAASISAALHEFAAATAATLGKHGSSIVAALQQLAARIVAALKLTAASVAAAVNKYRSSIAKAGLQLRKSRAVTKTSQLVA